MPGPAGRDSHFHHGSLEEQLSLPFPKQKPGGVSFLRGGAKRYNARQGLPDYQHDGLEDIQADPLWQRKVARHYEQAESAPTDHRVRKAYDALRDETNKQFEYLTSPRTAGGLGMQVEVVDHDPYKTIHEARHDVVHNRRLKVMSTKVTGSHPMLSDDENDRFRAVHDAFGHMATGRDFSRNGEEAAYHSHVQMYSRAARPAMAAETRAQNSSLNFGKQEGFPKQKALAMPEWALRNRLPKR